MRHDPEIFPEPDQFHPERWFSKSVPTFPNQAFGFGARLCPGRFFARRSIWANIERRDERVASHQVSSKEEGVERVEVGRILPASQRGRIEGLNT